MKKTLTIALALCLAVSAIAQTQTIRAFSHRGGRLERDENTAKAFQDSWDAGYTGFETDIRRTKDGVLYLTHDHTLERTTNGTGIFEQKTSAEIEQLRTKQGNKMMKFDEFIEFLQDKDNLYVEFELKTKPVELYPQELVEEVAERVYQAAKSIRTKNSVLRFTSSDIRGLRYLKKAHPEMISKGPKSELLIIFTTGVTDETIETCKKEDIWVMGCKTEGTTRKMVQKAHKEGMIVSLWPTQKIEDFMLAAYLGSDAMCTDIPFTMKPWLEKNAPWLNVIY
ncbi:MAG: glycerophosphodiester phosphodiesterase family protein [Bacteroidales bacterium]|nr:glycerophosphodiester phosphodiesterase family protein [Bacteroidales bacterium]MBR0084823.1 glycerophosphodiester phosphodiesterase family protein [Bacteroidales bacterium]MBR0291509.1 glycerophosphodiester phosphodiesterase family protein [Bacteroidales bacterium]